jgi:hypothetical protein
MPERQVADCVAHCFCVQNAWSRVYTCCRCRFRAVRTNPDLVFDNSVWRWLWGQYEEAH